MLILDSFIELINISYYGIATFGKRVQLVSVEET